MLITLGFREAEEMANKSLTVGLSNAEATSLEQVSVPVYLFLGMILVSLVAFIKELLNQVTNNFKGVTIIGR